MTTVKIALAVLLLASITCNGFGFTRIARRTLPECHEVDDCNLILPNCKGEMVCDKGVCICFQSKGKQECHAHTDCEAYCSPPCGIPYCDMTDSLCRCDC